LSKVHCSPFQFFSGSLPSDTQSREVLDVLTPPCYDTDTDIADFDECIHVGRRRWDIVGHDLDPIYDTESHFQLLPLQLSQQITSNQWQQGDEVFTIQRTKDDPIPYDFQSYLEDFDDCSFEHLDLFCEDDYQTPICSDFGTSENVVCLGKVSHSFSLQPPFATLPCLSIKGVLGKYIFNVEFPFRQTLSSKGWLNTVCFSQFFNFPLIVCQSSAKSLSIPSLILEHEDVLGN
jgi:hypothetical protein